MSGRGGRSSSSSSSLSPSSPSRPAPFLTQSPLSVQPPRSCQVPNPFGTPILRAQTLSPIRIIATGPPFQELPSLLVGSGQIHDLHDLHTLQCTVPTGVLPAAPARHKGRPIADKRGTGGFVAGCDHRLGGLIKANRIHCSVTVWAERHKGRRRRQGELRVELRTSEVREGGFIYPGRGPCELSSIIPTLSCTARVLARQNLAVGRDGCNGCLEHVDPNRNVSGGPITP